MYSGITKMYCRKTVGHVFTKPVQIEGTKIPPPPKKKNKVFFIVVSISAARRCECTSFVQKVSELTTVHEVDKVDGVLTLTVFNTVPFRSYTIRPTFLPLLEAFCELLFRDV